MSKNPEEFNILNGQQFKMEIHNLRNFTYWIQTTFLPSVTLEGGLLPSPNREIPVPGHKLEFDSLTVTYLVDQDLRNYEEIYKWVLRISQSENFADMVSDVDIHFLTGQMNISRTVRFVNAFPTTLTEVNLNSDDSDTVQVVGSIIFQYQYFTFSDTDFPL